MKAVLAILFWISTGYVTVAQLPSKKIASIQFDAAAKTAYIDRAGQVYVLTESTYLHKVADDKLEYSTNLKTTPTLFDPRDGSHLFMYFREQQEYMLMLPDLSIRPPVAIDEAYAVSPFLVCPSGEQHLLILDSADWSLKKINPSSRSVMYETVVFDSVQDAASLIYLREYQNFIFLLDHQHGILIFNMMGKRLKTIEDMGINYLSFLGEEIYYFKDGKLHFFNLFTAESRSLDVPVAADFVFLTDERMFVVRDRTVEIFK